MTNPALPPEELCGCGRPLHYTDPRIEAEVRRLAKEYGLCVRVTVHDGSYFVPRHYMALHGMQASEIEAGAKRHGFAKIEFCPQCGHDLTQLDDNQQPMMIPDRFPPQFYGRKVGIEVPGVYDGVLFWTCPDCGGRWHRFDANDGRYRAAIPYVEGTKDF